MNIFRDLVEELKEENLLEETVIEPVSGEGVPSSPETPAKSGADVDPRPDDTNQVYLPSVPQSLETEIVDSAEEAPEEHADAPNPDRSLSPDPPDDRVRAELNEPAETPVPDAGRAQSEADPEEHEFVAEAASQESEIIPEELPKARTPDEDRKFFRQRAMDEVTGLQLVEHVLSGVEREQMKTAPKQFDDLSVKRALHDFLKIADDLSSPEHAKAEFNLMQETENWASALSRRDRNIAVADLRRYCETTKPSLSSQAMISLARFYRNSPFSESVRSKFDLVFTKLFSKDLGNEKRAVVFKNEELVRHIQGLYADWSSVPLYSTDDDDSELLLSALKFQEFISEANDAQSFDELVQADFFKRLKVFKEKNNENFFAPIIVAAAIESNIAVGNRYVDLIEKERQHAGEQLGEKYGVSHDDAISEATSKTVELLEMLRVVKEEPEPEPLPDPVLEPEAEKEPASKPKPAEVPKPRFSISGGANKWLIVVTVAVLLLTGWYFMQDISRIQPTPTRANGEAREFTLLGTSINDHVHSARVTKSTMFGITRDSWDSLSKEEKTMFVEKALALGKQNEFERVHLLNKEGQTVAFGSKTQLAIY